MHYRAARHHLHQTTKTRFKLSARVFNRLREESLEEDEIKFLPLAVQKLSPHEWHLLVDKLQTEKTLQVARSSGIGKKTLQRILKFYGLHWIRSTPQSHNGETSIERIVREYLDDKNVAYKQEIKLDRYWFDFLVGKSTLIEAQGDFWHCNPQVYEKPECSIQRSNLRKDKNKLLLAHQKGYTVVYVWEYDLINHQEATLSRLWKKISRPAV